jgi:hypothetical protein
MLGTINYHIHYNLIAYNFVDELEKLPSLFQRHYMKTLKISTVLLALTSEDGRENKGE